MCDGSFSGEYNVVAGIRGVKNCGIWDSGGEKCGIWELGG